MSSRNSAPRGNACVPCRTRKVKCGGEKPSCGVCIQAGRLCEYAARLNITQKLEKKVQELQDQLYQATVAQTRSSSRSVPRFGVLALQVQALRPPALPQIPSLAVLPSQLQTWNANDEVPPQLRLNMLRLFIHHQSHFNLDLFVPWLQERMILPSTSPRSLHPSLTYAICLVGASCLGPELQAYEGFFLRKLRDACHTALSMVDRLDDYFLSQLLEAHYLLRVGRLQEAYLVSATLLRFALACEIHCISDPREHLNSYAGLLGRPSDAFHVSVHINLWWSCYYLARRLATVTGLSDGLPSASDVVSTVFPVSLRQVQQMGFGAWSMEHVSTQPRTSLLSEGPETELSLAAKCAVVTSQLHAYLASQYQLDPAIKFQMRASTNAVAELLLMKASNFPPVIGTEGASSLNPAITNVQVDLLSVMIGLNQPEGGPEDILRTENRLRAARGLARLARSITPSAQLYTHIPLVCPMQLAATELIEALERARISSTPRSVQREYQNDLFAIAEFLSELPTFFPQLRSSPTVISTLRIAD